MRTSPARRTTVPALAVATALAVLATGCSGGGPSDGSSVGAPRPHPAPAWPDQREQAPRVGGETRTADDPDSTFALDVDTASYGYAARSLQDGRLPDPGSVRPEEFVNSFRQDYPEPAGDGFTVHVDGARLPFPSYEDTRLLRVGLQTRSADTEDRPDAVLTFVVDVSGSMAEPGRLDLVKDTLHVLVDRLRPGDAVGLVAYSDSARPLSPVVPVRERADLHRAIDRLRTEGSTNLEAGLVTGYDVARRGFRPGSTNRVVLLTDGLANTGATDADTILERVREQAGKGIALLTVGVGSEYGDRLMERLADGGDGIAAYVGDRAEAERVFVERLPATVELRALDAKAQVSFRPETVESYRLVGYEDRAVSDDDFRDDAVDGGEVGPGHSVTALYVVRLRPGAEGEVATATVRWADPRTREPSERSATVSADALAGALDEASLRLRVDAVAAVLAERLRDAAPWRGEHGRDGHGAGLERLVAQADRVAALTEDPAVEGLARMTRRAAILLT